MHVCTRQAINHYPSVFLSWNRCSTCWNEHSNQCQIPPEDLLGSYTLNDAHLDGDHLRVTWADDVDTEHVGLHPLNWLKENAYGDNVLTKRATDARPKVLESGQMSVFDYKDVISSKEVCLDWMIKVYEDGCSMLRGVPCEYDIGLKVAGHVYNIQWTCYDDVWNVVSSKEPVNLAFNEGPLPLHNDLVFYESPPGIQFLFCLKKDECVVGGDSVLVDAIVAAEEFRKVHHEEFRTLTKVHVNCSRINYKRDKPAHYILHRPIISVGYNDEVIGINWSPQGEGTPCLPHDQVEEYYQARWKWASHLKNFPVRHTFTLRPGDLVTFNNHRMLHSRKHFQLNGGERHLQGCYVNIDDFKSEVIVRCTLQGRQVPSCRQGNGDFLE